MSALPIEARHGDCGWEYRFPGSDRWMTANAMACCLDGLMPYSQVPPLMARARREASRP